MIIIGLVDAPRSHTLSFGFKCLLVRRGPRLAGPACVVVRVLNRSQRWRESLLLNHLPLCIDLNSCPAGMRAILALEPAVPYVLLLDLLEAFPQLLGSRLLPIRPDCQCISAFLFDVVRILMLSLVNVTALVVVPTEHFGAGICFA